jgi:LPXTG-motif cell wall-anchored protein
MRVSRLAGCALAATAASVAIALPASATSSSTPSNSTPSGSNNIIVTYAGNGSKGYSGDGGQATSAQIATPDDVLLDNAANVFIADTANNVVRKVTADGVITTVAGNGVAGYSGDGGPATAAMLNRPGGLAIDSAGNLYISDTGNNRVRKVATNGTITTILGAPNTSPQLNGPRGLAFDGTGNLYVADTGDNIILKRTPGGSTTTFAGKQYNAGDSSGSTVSSSKCKFSGNGGPATNAYLCIPRGVAVSGAKVLIADTGNNQVRQVNGGTITAFAGTGTADFSGDGGQASAAKLKHPTGVTFDRLGNAQIVDAGNNRVRQVTTSGTISTLIGNGMNGYGGDNGPCENAMIQTTGGISADSDNIFLADTANNRIRRCHKGGPPPALPETSWAQNVALATSAAAVLAGGVFFIGRRRRRNGTLAA